MKKLGNYLWVEQVGEEYVLSMTPELQDDVGTVGYVEFTKATHVEVGDSLLSLEASKTVLDVFTPLAGDVVAFNDAAVETPHLLNSASEQESWLVRLTNVDAEAFKQLPDAE